jgi:hypothetical protein|tara:strand:- start:1470 stop:2033 length:564 start_codon:yes stop_codon:yes gene_type:complete
MNFNTEWNDILENLGGELEIREMAREQGFLGWKQGTIQPIIGFDDTWMNKPQIVGLGIIVPSAILCMSRDLEDFDSADTVPDNYLGDYESLSELLLAERRALLALEQDIVEAEKNGWNNILIQVRRYGRSNNIEGFQLNDSLDNHQEVLGDFLGKIYDMLEELQITSEIITDEHEIGFSKEFQEKWA